MEEKHKEPQDIDQKHICVYGEARGKDVQLQGLVDSYSGSVSSQAPGRS